MHAFWILLCMLLNLLSYSSLMTKEGIDKRNISEGELAGRVPGQWVAGYVTVWYQSFWLKHWAGMDWVCWSESRVRDRILTGKLKILGGMALQKIHRRQNVIEPL
jgi:hypothetical protein